MSSQTKSEQVVAVALMGAWLEEKNFKCRVHDLQNLSTTILDVWWGHKMIATIIIAHMKIMLIHSDVRVRPDELNGSLYEESSLDRLLYILRRIIEIENPKKT